MKKILVVEDDQDLFALLQYNLEKEGFPFAGMRTGTGALDLCRSHRPDLILLDIMLPDSDGREICKQIRDDAELAPIPVILLSARASNEDPVEGLELGATDYVTKPFLTRELIGRIRSYLQVRETVVRARPAGVKFERHIAVSK